MAMECLFFFFFLKKKQLQIRSSLTKKKFDRKFLKPSKRLFLCHDYYGGLCF